MTSTGNTTSVRSGGGGLLEMFLVFIFSGNEENFLRHQVFSI